MIQGENMEETKDSGRGATVMHAISQSFCTLSHDNLDVIFRQGCMQYHSGQLTSALKTFRYLCLNDSGEARNFLGLAIILKKLELYEQAVVAFSCAHRLDSKEPKSVLAMADCLKFLGEYSLALDVSELAIKKASEVNSSPNFIKYAERCKETIKKLAQMNNA